MKVEMACKRASATSPMRASVMSSRRHGEIGRSANYSSSSDGAPVPPEDVDGVEVVGV